LESNETAGFEVSDKANTRRTLRNHRADNSLDPNSMSFLEAAGEPGPEVHSMALPTISYFDNRHEQCLQTIYSAALLATA
jgi:hypothetical protein